MTLLYSLSTTVKAARRLLLGLLATAAAPALAQTIYTPVALTASSFTADVVANGAGTALSSTTTGFDTGGTDIQYCLVAPDFVSPTTGATTRSLPANRVLQSAVAATAGLTFQLQPYNGPNSLRISGTGSGTLTLATPQATRSVWLAAATGNGAPGGNNPVTATVTFTDGTTQVFSLNVSDWFGGANYAANNLGRVGRTNDRFETAVGEPRLYQFEMALAATNYGKLVSSVQFAKTQPTGVATATVFNGMALTLAAPCLLPTAIVAAAAPTTVCPGQPAQLTATLTGGGAGYTGQWQSSANGLNWTDIAGATALTYTVTPTTTLSYRYRVVCTAGPADASNEVRVTVPGAVAALAYANATYCRTGSTGAPTATPAGGTFTASPAGLSLDAATGAVNLAASTAGTYTITYTSTGQCPSSATATLTVLAPVATLAYANATYCRTGTSGLPTVTPAGGTFAATPAGLSLDATTGAINLAASTAGTYTVTYTVPGQCPAVASFTVTVLAPVVTLTYANATYCRTGSTGAPVVTPAGGTFTAAPAGLSLSATTGDINLAASTAGTYTITYTSPGPCPVSATATVTVLAPVVVLAYATTVFCRVGTSGQPAASPAGGTFRSSPGLALNPTTGQIDLAASAAGTYVVSYTSTGQCPTTATATVEVKSDALPIFPNVLTPNGDNQNDALRLSFSYPVTDISGFRLLVFSRWGRKMYEGTNPAEGWAPTDVSGGTYYYTVDYTDCAGRPQHYKGWVEVVR